MSALWSCFSCFDTCFGGKTPEELEEELRKEAEYEALSMNPENVLHYSRILGVGNSKTYADIDHEVYLIDNRDQSMKMVSDDDAQFVMLPSAKAMGKVPPSTMTTTAVAGEEGSVNGKVDVELAKKIDRHVHAHRRKARSHHSEAGHDHQGSSEQKAEDLEEMRLTRVAQAKNLDKNKDFLYFVDANAHVE